MPNPPTAQGAGPAAPPRRARLLRPGRRGGFPSKPPTADPRSFMERYQGTAFETPEGRAMTPRSGTRLVRLGAALLLIIAVLGVAGYGAMHALVPAGSGSTPTGSRLAQASSPVATPIVTPAPVVSFTPAQTAEIAFCLAVQETNGLDTDIATVRAAVAAADHPIVATEAAALVARATEMGLAAQEMTSLHVLAAYAAGYDAGLKGVGTAASALATAGAAANAKAEAAASTALAKALVKVTAANAQRVSLTAANPELACTAAG